MPSGNKLDVTWHNIGQGPWCRISHNDLSDLTLPLLNSIVKRRRKPEVMKKKNHNYY